MMENKKYELIVIGGSAGSLSIVLKLLPHLKKISNVAIILVFHRKQSDDTTLIDLLSTRTEFAVKEVDDKDEITSGVIYVAPADFHVLIEKDKTLTLDDSEKINFSRPSIDVTFESAADVFKEKLMCVLLSGANADGVEGLRKAKTTGAYIIVQDPASAEVPFMPQQAIDHVQVDFLLKPDSFPDLSNGI